MNVDGIVPYSIIVMGFVPRGTLCQYLKETIIDWNQMCRLALSAASGLAHLHTDILVGGKLTLNSFPFVTFIIFLIFPTIFMPLVKYILFSVNLSLVRLDTLLIQTEY